MKFQTKWDREPHEKTKASKELLVNRAGYIPTHRKVQALLEAGRRLVEYREQSNGGYDFETDEIDETYYPETRRPGYDMADASMAQNALKSKYDEKKRQAAVKAAEKASDKKNSEIGDHTAEKPESPE